MVVLKVAFQSHETRNEADALRLWNGEGAVMLLEHDRGRGGMLLERLVPGSYLQAHPRRDEAISIVCRLATRLRRRAPEDHPFASTNDIARRFAVEMPADQHRLGRPAPQRLVTEAAETCAELSRGAGDDVIVNWDLHLQNVLSAEREPWLLIDPKPLVGDPAFDAGHLLQDVLPDRPTRAEVDAMSARLAEELAIDPDRAWKWAFVRAVENVIWAAGRRDPWGERQAHIAELLSASR
jgi:streptomycin 6-kinase